MRVHDRAQAENLKDIQALDPLYNLQIETLNPPSYDKLTTSVSVYIRCARVI